MPNRLANATSPYLLQHAHNPVDWHEWGAEALERARREQKPLLVSIGYAACHWCHVMERESFEDPAIAALMNEHFVCIKVDREERPDLDAIYMDAVQALTGHGGWPMTMFCSPDGAPLWGGTYFPPEDRHGLPSFRRVLNSVAEAWSTQRDDLLDQGRKVAAALSRTIAGSDGDALARDALRAAFERMAPAFDQDWGGFGRAPKFPQPMSLDFLLRCVRMGFEGADVMLTHTLARMACGGMFDQAGGGFHRYSVDERWLVPHFEKMLYDNALLLRLYARAAVVAEAGAGGALTHGLALWVRTATHIGEYLLREMRHPAGGFYSSQDADSEGVEGKFYVWSYDDFARVAGDDARAAAAMLGVTEEGNWEGTNILWLPRAPSEVAASLGIDVADLEAATQRALRKLSAERAGRVAPATDDKILASWNGLAISALAEAGRILRRDDFVRAARDACDFALAHLRNGNRRVLRSWRDGRTSGEGFLDDYALLGGACLDLYETLFDDHYFDAAREIAADMVRLFADPAGGFFDTAEDAETLITRPKDVFDNAVPSGNAAAASLLLRIGALTNDAAPTERAERAIAGMQQAMQAAPQGFGVWLCCLDDVTFGIREIAIAGDVESAKGRTMAQVAWARPMLPRVVAGGDPARSRVPLLAGRAAGEGATAYVCERFVCRQPVAEPGELATLLDATTTG